MENTSVIQRKPKGLWLTTVAIVLFVPLPWYVCFIGCKWVFNPLMSNFAWFRLILLSPWVTPLAFILPFAYIFGIHYLLARFIDRLSKRNIIMVACIVAALYVASYIINEVL